MKIRDWPWKNFLPLRSGETEVKESFTIQELFEPGLALAYDDTIVTDRQHTTLEVSEINPESYLGVDEDRRILLQTPLIASPMDTITSPEMCIAVALQGGIGAVHGNHKYPDGTIDEMAQAADIAKVKRQSTGLGISDPLIVSPDITIEQARDLGRQFMIDQGKKTQGSGIIDTFPVTEDGSSDTGLVGFLTKECYFTDSDLGARVQDRMMSLEELQTRGTLVYDDQIDEAQARDIMSSKRLRHLLVLGEDRKISYLITKKDIERRHQYPLSTRDEKGRLRVLFAVGTRGFEERAQRGFDAGADGVIIDTSQGNTKFAKETAVWIRDNFPDKLIIGGNVSTYASMKELASYGLDAIREGQGGGSICSTQNVIGTGNSSATTDYWTALAGHKYGMTAIADGGIRYSGDAFKAIAFGCGLVMVGNYLAGTHECPGEIKWIDGRAFKVYRGMGSKEAQGDRDYGAEAQGVEASVPYKGSVHGVLTEFRDSIQKALQVQNCATINELHRKVYAGQVQFNRRAPGAIVEGSPHTVAQGK